MAFLRFCVFLMLHIFCCHGNDIVAVIEQDVYNLHFRTFYLSVGRPEMNMTGAIYPTYTGVYDQLRGVCSYLTQRTMAVFVVGNQESIHFVSMVTDVLGIPTLAYVKDSKTAFEKVSCYLGRFSVIWAGSILKKLYTTQK